MNVYLIEEPEIGLVKIGVSAAPFRRLAFLQTQKQNQIFLRYQYDAGNRSAAFRIERDAHIRLAGVRETGEWFRCSVDDARKAVEDAIAQPTPRTEKRKLLPTSLVFSDAEKCQLDQFAAEFGVGRVEAIMIAIEGYPAREEISRERLVAEIKRRLE